MQKKEKQLRALDALTVYGISLVLNVICTMLLRRLIGVYAFYLGYALVAATVIVVAHITRLKSSAVFKFGSVRIRDILASGLLLAGAILISFPIILLIQIVLPDFAAAGFSVLSLIDNSGIKYLHVVLLVILSSASESMLFDGYIYTRMAKTANLISVSAAVGIAYALFRHDLYVLVPLFVSEAAIIYVRNRVGNSTLPLVMHIIINTAVIAFTDVAAGAGTLFGAQIGLVNVIGMGMILIGTALPVTALGMRALGDLKEKPVFQKVLLLVAAIILIASGYAVSSL